jgi:hypothetical protein
MTTWKPHVTVAAIAEKDNKCLIVEERVDGQLVYNQPGYPGSYVAFGSVMMTLRFGFKDRLWALVSRGNASQNISLSTSASERQH